MDVRNPIAPSRVAFSQALFPNGIQFGIEEGPYPDLVITAEVPHRFGSGKMIRIQSRSPFRPSGMVNDPVWTKVNLHDTIVDAIKSFVAHEVSELLTLDGTVIHEPHADQYEPGDFCPIQLPPLKEP